MDRIRALDGLRGIAALIVVFHHLTLLNPRVSDIYLAGAVAPVPGSMLWVLTATPLMLLVMGQEAVLIFFVLSGLVVALPALQPGFDWLAYYPRRILRLMLPVAGSVVLAVVIILVTHPDPRTASSGWAALYSFTHLDWRQAVSDVDLLFGDTALNNPLWSLRWELVFSLLLPVYVAVATLFRRRWMLAAVGALVLVAFSFVARSATWHYLPIFFLGTLLAVSLPELQAATAKPSGARANVLWVIGLGLALAALAARWILWPEFPHSAIPTAVGSVIAAAGATAIVLIVVLWRPVGRLLETPPIRWLGRVSFSLYLVHVPIVIGVGALMAGRPWYLSALIALPIALIVAELFSRFVEMPSHRLSRTAGRVARTTMDRAYQPPAAR